MTIGVYTRANLVIKFSVGAFLLVAFSTISSTLETVDSLASLVTLTVNKPLILIQPESTISPFVTFTGTDSPVRIFVSIVEAPDNTSPSSGILSPGLMIIISPV